MVGLSFILFIHALSVSWHVRRIEHAKILFVVSFGEDDRPTKINHSTHSKHEECTHVQFELLWLWLIIHSHTCLHF
jgi:hypothetical protein